MWSLKFLSSLESVSTLTNISLNIWLPGERRGEQILLCFNSLETALPHGEYSPVSVLASQWSKSSNHQWETTVSIFGRQGPYFPLWHQQAISWLWVAIQLLPAAGMGGDSRYYVKGWNSPQFSPFIKYLLDAAEFPTKIQCSKIVTPASAS